MNSQGPAHGGAGADFLRRHYPHATTPWLDLSTGINPWPYPYPQISPAALQDLPSPSNEMACRDVAAAYFGCEPERLALLPGSQAAISLLPGLFARTTVAVLEPGYSEHAASWTAHGHTVTSTHHPTDIDTQILVLTNPNNPDGRNWTCEKLREICAARSTRNQWLVLDEAFIDVMPEHSLAAATGNLVIFRSFGKFFGLAGLRLGFAIAPPNLVRRLRDAIGPWAVSGAALEIGARACADRSWQAQTRVTLAQAAQDLRALLARHGLRDAGGTDLFCLAEHDRAADLFECLCRGGIYVRRFADRPDWLRFGLPKDHAAVARLEDCLRDWAQSA